MKLRVLSLIVPALLMAGTAGAAEIYNKDGNKLDLFGKIDGLHYFSDNDKTDGDRVLHAFWPAWRNSNQRLADRLW